MEETCWVVFCKNKHTRHLKATALKLSKHSFQKIVHLHVFRHGNALDCKIMTVPELCNRFLQLHSNNAEFEFDCPNHGSSGEFLQAGTGPCAKQAHTCPGVLLGQVRVEEQDRPSRVWGASLRRWWKVKKK